MPSARRILEEAAGDRWLSFISLAQPTGPKGHITKGDALKFIASKDFERIKSSSSSSSSTSSSSFNQTLSIKSQQPITSLRIDLTAAPPQGVEAFIESKRTIPHAYMMASTSVDEFQTLVANSSVSKDYASKAYLLKAVAVALQLSSPEIAKTSMPLAYHSGDGNRMLIVLNAHHRGVADIASNLENVASSNSNVNQFSPILTVYEHGVLTATEIIQPTSTLAIAFGSVFKTVVADEKPRIGLARNVTLSYDGRVWLETTAASILSNLTRLLANPSDLLMISRVKQ